MLSIASSTRLLRQVLRRVNSPNPRVSQNLLRSRSTVVSLVATELSTLLRVSTTLLPSRILCFDGVWADASYLQVLLDP